MQLTNEIACYLNNCIKIVYVSYIILSKLDIIWKIWVMPELVLTELDS